jgi:hypothetical protein
MPLQLGKARQLIFRQGQKLIQLLGKTLSNCVCRAIIVVRQDETEAEARRKKNSLNG